MRATIAVMTRPTGTSYRVGFSPGGARRFRKYFKTEAEARACARQLLSDHELIALSAQGMSVGKLSLPIVPQEMSTCIQSCWRMPLATNTGRYSTTGYLLRFSTLSSSNLHSANLTMLSNRHRQSGFARSRSCWHRWREKPASLSVRPAAPSVPSGIL